MSSNKRKRDFEYDFPWLEPSSSSSHCNVPRQSMLPTSKRPRKKSVSVPEKRGAIFKKKCPKNILDRVERVISQRFFLVDRKRNGDELREEFSVLGSTGNVYSVVISKRPTCNCPDAMKGNHCKHILFIFLKVLQVAQASGYWYQKALLSSELATIFAEAPLAPNSMAIPGIREAYARVTGKASATSSSVDSKKRLPGPDDNCPICYEGMHGVEEISLTFCHECGNGLHTECFRQWQITTTRSGKTLTCVWCRATWIITPQVGLGDSKTSPARSSSEGYINLASIAGVSTVRDASTYYHGPRRGQRFNRYQDYDCVTERSPSHF